MKKAARIDRVTSDEIFATYNENANGHHPKAFIKVREDFSFKINNSRNFFVKKGDSVEIFIEPRGAIIVTFFMFIFPLILFIVFYSLAGLILHNGPEGINILLGISGIVISFVSTYAFLKHHPQKLPEITRVLSKSEIAASCPTGTGCGSCSSCS